MTDEKLIKQIINEWTWATSNRKKEFTDQEAAELALKVVRESERERSEKIIGHYISTCQFIKEENLIVQKALWQAEKM
jgi:hypothetical protein